MSNRAVSSDSSPGLWVNGSASFALNKAWHLDHAMTTRISCTHASAVKQLHSVVQTKGCSPSNATELASRRAKWSLTMSGHLRERAFQSPLVASAATCKGQQADLRNLHACVALFCLTVRLLVSLHAHREA